MRVCVISHKRSKNVQKVQKILGTDIFWYVGSGEKKDYEAEGALNVIESGGLCRSRNAALDDAFSLGKLCVQVSDDISKIALVEFQGDKKIAVPFTFQELLTYMEREINKTPFKLCGVAPTPNPFFYHSEYSTNLFIVGDLLMVKPCTLRFDETLRLKEDYDYTAQHLVTYGGALRLNKALVTFAHKTNKGGAVDYRTSEVEEEAISILASKYPGLFRRNPRRKNEILMRKLK